MNNVAPVIYLIAAILGGVGVELVRATLGRKRMHADTAKAITEAAVSLVQPLQEKAERLSRDLAIETKRCARLEKELGDEKKHRANQGDRIKRLEKRMEELTEENAVLRRRLDSRA